MIIYKFDLCTRKWVCTRTSIYVQIKMDVHRRVGTYTVREAHWFESIFTGNNVSFNTNGIQCICTDKTKTKDRSLSVKKYFQKVSVLCTDKSFVFWKETVYVWEKCWFEYTEVKTDDRNCPYLSIKGSICIMDRWNLFVFEESLICTKKYYVHKRMLWDLHRNGGPLIWKQFHRE